MTMQVHRNGTGWVVHRVPGDFRGHASIWFDENLLATGSEIIRRNRTVWPIAPHMPSMRSAIPHAVAAIQAYLTKEIRADQVELNGEQLSRREVLAAATLLIKAGLVESEQIYNEMVESGMCRDGEDPWAAKTD